MGIETVNVNGIIIFFLPNASVKYPPGIISGNAASPLAD